MGSDGCPISTDNGITPKDVINAFWVVRCGTTWECAGQKAVELIILPDNASPFRIPPLYAVGASLVCTAPATIELQL